jgi:integrase
VAASSIGQYRFRLNTWRYWLYHPPRGRHRKDWWQAAIADLDAFLGRKCQPKHLHAGQPLSAASRAMYSSSIPPLYHTCYAKGLIDADPFAGYEPLPFPRPAPRPLDVSEVQRLFDYTATHPDPRLHPAAHLCFYDALRSGEPTELLVEDVELGGKVPRINLLGKGRDQRDWFPLHSAALPALERYLSWLASRYGTGDWRQLPAGTPLFQSLTRMGVPIHRSYLTRLLARAMRDAGVRGRPHDLRRTGANLVAETFDDNPGPLRFVLRHRGYSSLEAYRVVSLERGQKYLDAIELPNVLIGE